MGISPDREIGRSGFSVRKKEKWRQSKSFEESFRHLLTDLYLPLNETNLGRMSFSRHKPQSARDRTGQSRALCE